VQEATNYSQLATVRNNLIEQYLNKNKTNANLAIPTNKLLIPERMIWLSVLGVSLLVIMGLLVRLGKSKKLRGKDN